MICSGESVSFYCSKRIQVIMDNLFNVYNDILQAQVDALEEEIHLATNVRKNYTVQQRLNAMAVYNEEEFRRRFRLSKAAVEFLYSLIGAELEPLVTREGFTISGMDKILITLRYYATASYHLVTADFIGVSDASVCNIVPIVSDRIAALRERFIQMPLTDVEIERSKREFFAVAGMPATIGAIDGTLVKIQEVGGMQNKTDFFCRKQFYAVNTQIVCDVNAKVNDIVARWPGSTHDQTVFVNSNIFERFLTGEFNRNNRQSILLGDGGYRAEEFLATPLRATNPLNRRSERLYQAAHIKTRNVVERFNGIWKKRFPCLWLGMRFRKLETVLNVIVATAVLHNICKILGDTHSPPLTRDEELLYMEALQQERDYQNARVAANIQPNTIPNEMLKHYFETVANE